jgi:MOSC domain-containing protein YiiM
VATVTSVNISKRKGTQKQPVGEEPQVVIADRGLENDAHAGDWHRQVSFLAEESIQKAREMGLEVGPGAFAENFTTEGIDLLDLPLGTQLRVGPEVLVEISQIGKVCHTRCAIYHLAGDCIFPREGIFGVVLEGGTVKKGDAIEVVKRGDGTCAHTPPEALAEVEAARKAGTL